MAVFWIKEVAKAKGLGKLHKALLRQCADQARRDSGSLWTSQEVLALETGYCEKSVRNGLKALEAMGWIIRERCHNTDGSQATNMLTLRTFEDAKAFAVANCQALLDGGELETPAEKPTRISHPVKARRELAKQRVNKPTRKHKAAAPAATKPEKPLEKPHEKPGNDVRPVEKIHEDLMLRLQGEGLEPPAKWPAEGRKVGEP